METKEKILHEAVKLFAQKGYMGTSMNDIASQLGVTKAALYKHYSGKGEILTSIIKKMNDMDKVRAEKYSMPNADIPEAVEDYKNMAFEKIKTYTQAQFLHWTKEEFPCDFRKMLTLEQYRDKDMRELYQNYLACGPLNYMKDVFKEFTKDGEKAYSLALDFYGVIFLLYSVYDSGEDMQKVLDMLEKHVERFSKKLSGE